MKKKRTYISSKVALCLVLFFFALSISGLKLHAQKSTKSLKVIEKATQLYNDRQYQECEKQTLIAIQLDSTNIEAYLLLSDVCDELKNRKQQQFSLEKIIELGGTNYPKAYKILVDIYMQTDQFEKAVVILKSFFMPRIKSKNDSSFVFENIRSCEFAINQKNNNDKSKVQKLSNGINTIFQEYWPAVAADDSTFFFTRLNFLNNGMPAEKLFYCTKKDTSWTEPLPWNISSNQEINEGTMCMSADGTLLFITLCGMPDGKGSCDIYASLKVNGAFTKPTNIGAPVNTFSWESQPSVSADKEYLYFASNRSGGYGGIDIWRSRISIDETGLYTFGEPENLGPGVNTRKDDFSPFIHADGTSLYFASEGRVGMGGSDIFVSKFVNGHWDFALNVGAPINSAQNDDGLVVSPTANIVLFASDREGDKNIYQTELPKTAAPQQIGYIKGFVFNKLTNEKIAAEIEFKNLDAGQSFNVHSSTHEGYLATFKLEENYAVNVEEAGFLFFSEHINISEGSHFSNANIFNIYLSPIEHGQTLVLNNIFFEFDSHQLSPTSFIELDGVSKFLFDNPTMKVEISGFTDNKGDRAYNLKLSENRAKSIYEYLIKIIDYKRLSYKGYGDEKPIATNDTEKGRSKNRRSELKIISE